MTSLVTAILFVLLMFGGASCDSNPVPHPGQESADRGNDVYTPGAVSGQADGSMPPSPNDDDLDPSTDYGEGGAPAEPCAPDADNKSDADASDEADDAADADAGDGADDAADDDNATDVVAADADCGPTQVPAGAADQIEE